MFTQTHYRKYVLKMENLSHIWFFYPGMSPFKKKSFIFSIYLYVGVDAHKSTYICIFC
jgi:hypothetical protein